MQLLVVRVVLVLPVGLPTRKGVMVRVPLGEAVPVLLAVLVAVEVTVRRILCDWAGERETVALPVELREARVERVSVGLAVVVLEGAMDRVGLGDALEVLDRLEDPVLVFVPRTVAVVMAVDVVVFDPCRVAVGTGEAEDVLEATLVRVWPMVGLIVLLAMILAVQ